MKKGFTLVEMLLVTGILGILLVVFTQVLSGIFAVRFRLESTSALSQDMRYLYSKLSGDIAGATAITSPSVGVSQSTLVLTKGGTTYTYFLDDGNLMLQLGAGTPVPLSSPANNEVASFTVTRGADLGGKAIVTVELSLNTRYQTSGNPTQTEQFTTTIGMR